MRNRDLETIRQRVKGVRYLSPMIMQWGGQNNVVRGQKAGTYNVRGVYPNISISKRSISWQDVC